jgi:hypothetical protein
VRDHHAVVDLGRRDITRAPVKAIGVDWAASVAADSR